MKQPMEMKGARAVAASPLESGAKAPLEAATEAVVAQHDTELRRYLAGEMPANQWRPEAYAAAAVASYFDALLYWLEAEGLWAEAAKAHIRPFLEDQRDMAAEASAPVLSNAGAAAAKTEAKPSYPKGHSLSGDVSRGE